MSPKFALNAVGLPHSDAAPPDIESMIKNVENNGEKEEFKIEEDAESEGNYVEMYVDQ